MERFDSLIRIATQNRWNRGFQISGNNGDIKEICHLLYADNTVIFCLEVNWGKSSLYPIKDVTNIQRLVDILGYRVDKLPTTYLGMPLDNIVEKTEKRLARWKAHYISFGGRHILINYVLDSLPIYIMSLFTISAKVAKKLDKLRRDFLWHGYKENKGYNLVKDLRKHNNSLLMKWLWRYTEERQALWKDLIKFKYREDGLWCSNVSTDVYGAGVWRAIRNLWPKLEVNLHIKVGNEGELDSEQSWNLYFRRLLNDWEIERVAKLLEEVGDFAGTNTTNDDVRWSHRHIKRSATRKVADTEIHGKISAGMKHQQKLSALLEVKWTMPEHTTNLLSCWIKRGGNKRQKTWWNLIPHCIWWKVWKEWNSRNFEDISNSIHKVKWNCIVSLYFWCKEIGLEDSDQLLEFLGSL
ncbi:hypothetical protein H5410_064121 [Solanum commersonii]|uniref:Uncharacterized protein n=1 Tax=Solanum commersonii TaxID=4109 RepID=A0A9J5W068_SOLCO|nr:hypothetical protein H5410_064121 [Solanum commersonii]